MRWGGKPRIQGHLIEYYDLHLASGKVTYDDRGYLELPFRRLLAQWAKKTWAAVDKDVILLSWEKRRLLLPVDGSGDVDWGKKELNSYVRGQPLDDNGQPAPLTDEATLPIYVVSDEDETGHKGEEDDLEETDAGGGESDGQDVGAGRPAASNLTDE